MDEPKKCAKCKSRLWKTSKTSVVSIARARSLFRKGNVNHLIYLLSQVNDKEKARIFAALNAYNVKKKLYSPADFEEFMREVVLFSVSKKEQKLETFSSF